MGHHQLAQHRIPVVGAQLHATTWGSGPAIVALHAGVADHRSWQWSGPPWADAGHRVIAYDRRGFGASTWQATDHDHVADLIAVMDQLDVESAALIGNSQGGSVAIDASLGHPDRVTALVLVAPSVSGYPFEELWTESSAEQAQDRLLIQADAADDVDRVNDLEARYWLDGTEQPEERVGGAARELFLDMNGIALRAAPVGDQVDRESAWLRLAEVDAPTLVIAGAHDLPGQNDLCHRIAQTIPGARSATIADSAHLPMLDQPAVLTRLVLEFLGDVG